MNNTPSKKQDLSTVLSDLKKDYLAKLPLKILRLKELTQAENWEDLYTEYHKLKGTGKTYGFPEISAVCEKLEIFAQKKEMQRKSLFEDAERLIEDLRVCYLEGKEIDLGKHPFAKTLMRLGKKK